MLQRMTINMLRHASLRDILACDPSGSDPPAGEWPPPDSSRVEAVAVRRLPAIASPLQAVRVMEATVAGSQNLKRRSGVKGWMVRVRKPALCYTLPWEATARHRRGALPRRAVVIINTVHPETGLVTAGGPLYFNLLRWHLERLHQRRPAGPHAWHIV